MGPDGVHQEPGPAAGSRGGQAVSEAGGGAGAGERLTSDEHFTVDGTCWKLGREQKVFNARMARIRRLPTIPAIPR